MIHTACKMVTGIVVVSGISGIVFAERIRCDTMTNEISFASSKQLMDYRPHFFSARFGIDVTHCLRGHSR